MKELFFKSSENKVRKELERENKLTLSLLDGALESIAEGILIVDLEGKVTKANKKFVQLWRIPQDLMATQDDSKLLKFVLDQLESPKDFLNKVEELYSQPNKESFDILKFKDGRIFERYSCPQTISEKIVGRVWSFRDVTKQKNNEEKIKLFEHAIKSINDIVNIADFNDNLIFVNKAFCKAYGYTEEEILGKNSSIFWSSKNPKEVVEKILPATLDKGWQGELFNVRKDGTEFPIFLSTSVIRDEEGNPKALVGIAKDISERKRRENITNALYKISESVHSVESLNELYKKIHEIIQELMPANNFYISLYDPTSDLLSFPYFVDEVDEPVLPKKPGKGCTEYVLRTGEAVIIGKELSDELNRTGEVDVIGAPSEVWLGVPLKISDKTIGVMAVQDYKEEKAYGAEEKEILTFVSEQIATAIYKKRAEEESKRFTEELKSLNEQLIHSEKKLKELNANKDKFFSIISHDLKSPFNSLLGFSDQLSTCTDDFNKDEIRECAGYVADAAKNLYNLVENLLQWSLIQRGTEKCFPSKISIREFINRVVILLNGSAIKKGIHIRNEADEKLFVTADEDMLHSIFQNLISNAIKFTNRGGEIKIETKPLEQNVEISVIDNGVGMDDDALSKIFRIDVKHSTLGTASEHGSGLGLILVKELVERNSGKIWVESKAGVGTTFRFILPIN